MEQYPSKISDYFSFNIPYFFWYFYLDMGSFPPNPIFMDMCFHM